MEERIVLAATAADFDAYAALITEYFDWLRARYDADAPWLIDAVGSHQGIQDELRALSDVYSPPHGRALLALRGDEVVAGGAFKDLGEGACEMKRVFVPDRHQGRGTGRRLCNALISLATADGFAVMRLDTAWQNTEALALYTSLGFSQRPPYQEYPPELLPHLRFMERPLGTDPRT